MNYKNITMAELKELQKTEPNLVIMDVRTQNEASGGMVTNALLNDVFNQNTFLQNSQQYKNQPIAVYCRSGGRSNMAANILTQNGFENVYNCTQGYSAY